MNGTVVLGVVIIAAGIALNTGGWLGSLNPGILPALVIGVAVVAYGAFAPSKRTHTAPRRLPSDNDPFV
jgi:hypothetical protein